MVSLRKVDLICPTLANCYLNEGGNCLPTFSHICLPLGGKGKGSPESDGCCHKRHTPSAHPSPSVCLASPQTSSPWNRSSVSVSTVLLLFPERPPVKAYALRSGSSEVSCYANPAPFLALHPLCSIICSLPLPQVGCIGVVGLLRFGVSGIKPL